MIHKKISLIRGTGFKNLDGSLVTIVEERDDGLTAVVPYGTNFVPILIDSRCIQDVDDKETYTYEIKLEKYKPDGSGLAYFKTIIIDNALRDVSLDTIAEYLESNLKPILTME